MQQRLLSFAFFVSIVGIGLAWAQSQVEISGQATAAGSGGASASASAGGSASGHAGGRAGGSASGGSMGGFIASNGKVNGQNAYVVDYAEKSASSSATDGSQASVREHDSNYTVTLAKQGSLMMAGMYMDDGKRMIVILAKDDVAAGKVAQASPLVTKGYFTARVRPFLVSTLGSGNGNQMTKTEMVKPAAQPHP